MSSTRRTAAPRPPAEVIDLHGIILFSDSIVVSGKTTVPATAVGCVHLCSRNDRRCPIAEREERGNGFPSSRATVRVLRARAGDGYCDFCVFGDRTPFSEFYVGQVSPGRKERNPGLRGTLEQRFLKYFVREVPYMIY